MAEAQLGNPAGASGGTATSDALKVRHCVNGSGGALVVGDVVVYSGTDLNTVTTTTTAKNTKGAGVVGEPTPGAPGAVSSNTSYASGAVVPVIVEGPGRINIGANTIADGAVLGTSTTAKVADTAGTPTPGTVLAVAMETQAAKDAYNTIRAHIGKL